MSKAWVHAQSSAKRWGGKPEDYIDIHERMDSTKSAHAEVTHRCVFHSAFALNDQKEGMAAFVEKRKPAFGHD